MGLGRQFARLLFNVFLLLFRTFSQPCSKYLHEAPFGHVLGGLRALLAALLAVLARSWPLLGGSWAAVGGLLRNLGWPLARSGAVKNGF